jgi:diacylglycerol kinase (ATP)
MAGVGLDARVVAGVLPWLKRTMGVGAYYVAGAIALLAYRFPEFRIVADEREIAATACLIANSKGYGGGLLLTPQAEMTDGVLDLLVVQGRPKIGYARLLHAAQRGARFSFPWARNLRARKIQINGPGSVQVQVDGELCGSLPASVEVIPSALGLVVPQKWTDS